MLTRRQFFTRGLVATAGGILVAKELLSTKSYFLPPAGGWSGFAPGYPSFTHYEGGYQIIDIDNESWTPLDEESLANLRKLGAQYKREMWMQNTISNG